MKRALFLTVLLVAGGMNLNLKANSLRDEWKFSTNGTADYPEEKQFIELADQCLAVMEQAAMNMSINGAAVVAFIPGEVTQSWISKMKKVGTFANGSANFLAIAYTKAAEMADTYQNSGSKIREPLFGEHGFEGGLIEKVKDGYILTIFSGATGEQDTEVARQGMEWILKNYK